MGDFDALDRIARLLPAEGRERFYAIVSRLKEMPEDDELLLIVEAIGFMTLLWREVPVQIESILAQAEPVDGQGSRETTAHLLDQIKVAVRETVDQPSHEDLRLLLDELRDGQRQFQGAVKQLESNGNRRHHRRPTGSVWLTVVVLNVCVATGIIWWFYEQHHKQVAEIETNVTAAETVVRMLSQRPTGTITSYEGMDHSLGLKVRAVVIDGPVIDTFLDDHGRGVIRLQGTR